VKHIFVALTALCSVASLTYSPYAQANHGIRADLPCPFGPGGDPWTSSGTAAGSPFNPGISTATSATLSGPITFDDNNLTTTAATQYAYYAAPLPPVASCTQSPDPTPPVSPIAQVIDFTLAAGQSLNGGVAIPTGAIEVEFNYDSTSAIVQAGGPASFTMAGVTYTSTALGTPTGTLNDFFFNTNGSLFGSVSEDGSALIAGALPTGWSAKSSGGGGGTISAPEINSSSLIPAFTLLAGCLAVLVGRRRRTQGLVSAV
jgi:hypothetical protein